MVTREQFIKGIFTYADKEVIPYLPTAGKWGVGSIILISKNKIDSIIVNLMQNPIIQVLDIVNDEGLIDIDTLSKALIDSSEKYGKLDITIPFIGSMTFSGKDIDKIRDYINGGY